MAIRWANWNARPDVRPRLADGLSAEWRAVLMRDPCVYCGAAAAGLDHIWPRAAGGGDGWTNRAPACAECDNAKGANLLIGFLVGSVIAASRIGKRHYRSPGERRMALEASRARIAAQFYSGNIRGSEYLVRYLNL